MCLQLFKLLLLLFTTFRVNKIFGERINARILSGRRFKSLHGVVAFFRVFGFIYIYIFFFFLKYSQISNIIKQAYR